MNLRKNLGDSYSPLFFLAALGNGGLAITMFIYLNFMVPHPDTAIITFGGLMPVLTSSDPIVAGSIVLAMAGMLHFAFRHFWLLIWNLSEYNQFRRTAAHANLLEGNGNVTLMAIPLVLAMSLNVSFAVGAVFVPGLWNVVEYIFPVPLILFTLIGVLALRIFGRYFVRSLAGGSFNCVKNNSLSQMTTVFAFAMIAVGFAAPSAMSHNMLTATYGALGAIFFLSAAILFGMVSFVLGFRAMLENGVDHEASASLWIIIPILTLVAITIIRLSHGMHHHFEMHTTPAFNFLLTSSFVSLQLLLGGLGYAVMKQVRYYDIYVNGEGRSAGSYALICPGVALFVLGMFFLHLGLVKTGVIAKFSIPYFIMLASLAYLQITTIRTMWKLDRKLLRPGRPTPTTGEGVASPA